MNSHQSHSSNSTFNIAYSQDAPTEPQAASPCDNAYNDLRDAQVYLNQTIEALEKALAPALRADREAGQAGEMKDANPANSLGAESSLHERFLVADGRLRQATKRLNGLINRLTI